MSETYATNPTIFLRLRAADAAPRELAWDDFHRRYGPIIAAFARHVGARPQDVDDVVQDVLIGFFAQAPTFVYDPGKGRFRGYLKVCAVRAARRRLGREAKLGGRPLEEIDPEAVSVEQAWNDVWEQEKLRAAIEAVRSEIGDTKAFRAFEQYVVFGRDAQAVATELEMHLNSVYRAKDQVTRLLREKVAERAAEE